MSSLLVRTSVVIPVSCNKLVCSNGYFSIVKFVQEDLFSTGSDATESEKIAQALKSMVNARKM